MTISATTAPATPASAGGAAAAGTAATTGNSALNSLSSNFGDFLSLLTTQLQNQDPTSPMDSNQFTSELVQFSSVEQQINTNTSLTQLIQLTQAGEVMQSSAMVGKQVEVQSADLVLQNGQANVNFTAPAAEPVLVSVSTDSGKKLLDAAVTAAKGSNSWAWNGKDASGHSMPDGTYKVTVTGANVDGSSSALTYTVVGTATGVQTDGASALQLQIGALSVPFSAVRSVKN
jgi:flagellar basal-body rod modification protein FlgD